MMMGGIGAGGIVLRQQPPGQVRVVRAGRRHEHEHEHEQLVLVQRTACALPPNTSILTTPKYCYT